MALNGVKLNGSLNGFKLATCLKIRYNGSFGNLIILTQCS